MGTSGSELLVYGLIIAAFVLFNYLAQQVARKVREQQEAAEREAAPPPVEEEAPEDTWGRAAAATPMPVARAPEPVTALPPVPRAMAAGTLFRTRQDLRHAIVVMTVLGPCRALDPPSGPKS